MLALSVSGASGCIVAPCPAGRTCSAVENTGGSAGSAAAGNGGNGGNGASDGGSALLQDGGGTPAGAWVETTANLANMPSECGNMAAVTASPTEDLLITGVAQKGLWSSRNGGDSWEPLGTGAGSAVITNRLSSIVFDPDDPNRFWESGIYNGGGVYETRDDGVTFTQLGDVRHSDLVSVDFTDPDRKTLLSGGHEQVRAVDRSTDGGGTWSRGSDSLPANSTCSQPMVIDGVTHLVGCVSYSGGPSGVYRTTDGGAHWTQVSEDGGGGAPLRASDGSIYWLSPSPGGITRSTDDGATWAPATAKGLVVGGNPIELPGGQIAALGVGAVLVSADHGAHWRVVTSPLPFPNARGVAYSTTHKAFYVTHDTCPGGAAPVPEDGIVRYDFDAASL